jgi:putative ABC transport system permease protein
LFVRQGSTLALIGVTIGLTGALSLTRLMSNLLYRVSATDPMTLAGTAALLVLATLIPSYVAAHKAANVDPMVALRYE